MLFAKGVTFLSLRRLTKKKYWFTCSESNKKRKLLLSEKYREIFLRKAFTAG